MHGNQHPVSQHAQVGSTECRSKVGQSSGLTMPGNMGICMPAADIIIGSCTSGTAEGLVSSTMRAEAGQDGEHAAAKSAIHAGRNNPG